jgi:Carboxypeptidase regulatory-like domain
MTRLRFVAAVAVALCLMAGRLAAQASRDARLLVTVVDPSGGVIPNAAVTVVGLDEATRATEIAPLKTSEKGVATFDTLLPGHYSITGEFPGFDVGLLKDVVLKKGDNKHVVVLPLKGKAESVTVQTDRQAAAADRQEAFGTALTREQIDALSDDPDEMRRQLQDMAGPDAVFRVDSFEGQDLPPKAMIKAVHITRDAFAAENHYAGGLFIDIITQPGVGPLRGNARFNFYDSSMDGRNPFVPKKGPAQSRNYGGYLGGTLIKDKSDFSISVSGSNSYSTPILHAATPTGGTVSENLNARVPRTNTGVYGQLTYAITRDQTIRLYVSRNVSSTDNQGIGGYDQPERAYSTDTHSTYVRFQEAGPLARRFFTNTRFYVNVGNSTSHSVVDAPTYVVTDAFTSGGAQRTGGTRTKTFTFNSDLDYVRGIHSVRTGVQIDGSFYHSDASSNYLGTYTFASLDAFNAGQPLSYSRRIGDPNIDYHNVQTGLYLQDDIRFRKSLTVSVGARWEAQTHVHDDNNFGPRAGVTWAPFKSGVTTVRASWGIFYDWLAAGTYGQTVQFDGTHQLEVDLLDPTFPDPGPIGSTLPTNRYLLGDGLQLARNNRVSLGLSQRIMKRLSVGLTYASIRGSHLLVGENLNAPVDGVRPDPAFSNIIETVSDAGSRSHTLSAYADISLSPVPDAPGPMAPTSKAFFDWKRNLGVYTYVYYARSRNNTDGAFAVPATGDLAAEWGPASNDVRNRWEVTVFSGAIRNFNMDLSFEGSSAPPITIRTGLDDNGDLIFNDRPAGVGRNTARTSGQWSMSGYFSYSIGFGKRRVSAPGGIMITSSGGVLSASTMSIPAQPRYRLIISVNANNLTNHANLAGYSGVETSPFFLRPTTAEGVRRLSLSMTLTF